MHTLYDNKGHRQTKELNALPSMKAYCYFERNNAPIPS